MCRGIDYWLKKKEREKRYERERDRGGKNKYR
jgi:hypothetical protein